MAFNCIISFTLNIYYGTLYAYTPEVLPSAHRGTGNGIAIGWNRIMGIMSAVVATYADVSHVPLIIVNIRRPEFTNNMLCRRARRFRSISVRHSMSCLREYQSCSLLSRMEREARE